ncbi:MAG: TraR/DksA family transcriptional regulator [Candidatus Dormibacteraceae bacterium]
MNQPNQKREPLPQFRERLRRRLQILQLEENQVETELATEVDDHTCWTETGDQAQMLAEMENGFARRLVIEVSMNRTLRALERAVRGTYGLCEDCGVRIPEERLEVWPEATRCVRCQRLSDMRSPVDTLGRSCRPE